MTPTAAPSLEVLGGLGGGLDAAPEADRDDGRKGEEDAQGDAETPNGLDLVAGSLVRVHELEDVALGVLDVVVERIDEVGGVTLVGVGVALHVADGLADEDGHDDDHDENEAVGTSGDEHGKHRIPVEDVADRNVDCGQAALNGLVRKTPEEGKIQTYHYQSPNQGRRSDVARIDSLTDEVGRETNDSEQGNGLHDTHSRKGHAQGTESRSRRHLCEGSWRDERELRSS